MCFVEEMRIYTIEDNLTYYMTLVYTRVFLYPKDSEIFQIKGIFYSILEYFNNYILIA